MNYQRRRQHHHHHHQQQQQKLLCYLQLLLLVEALQLYYNHVIVTVQVGAAAYAPLLEDNVLIRTDIAGRPDVQAESWADSYSVNDSCYCATSFDHDIGSVIVITPLGNMTILDICELLGPGPGIENRPLYNDIQCGNGPPNNAGDEVDCPGRTEYGQEGCQYIGPKWNFTPHLPPTSIFSFLSLLLNKIRSFIKRIFP